MELSDKLLRILKSKTDLTDEQLKNITELKGWEIVYSLSQKKEKLIEICFTGFSPKEKKELTQIATKKNFHIAKSITKNLSFLCCGENAGPSKIEKAKKQNTQLIVKKDFLKLIETGEIPTANKEYS